MGPYCRFCDHRCFVLRTLPDGSWSGAMATCARGMALDRERTGHDHTTAVNPMTDRRGAAVASARRLLTEAEQIAAHLDGVPDAPDSVHDRRSAIDRELAELVPELLAPAPWATAAIAAARAVFDVLDDPFTCNTPGPGSRLGLAVAELRDALPPGPAAVAACRVCGCTDADCTGCVAATGVPCSWVEPDLCSRCAPARCDAASSSGHGCTGRVVDGQCTGQDDHHPTPGMMPCCTADQPCVGAPREWTPADGGRCVGAQYDRDRGEVCCGGPARLECGVGSRPVEQRKPTADLAVGDVVAIGPVNLSAGTGWSTIAAIEPATRTRRPTSDPATHKITFTDGGTTLGTATDEWLIVDDTVIERWTNEAAYLHRQTHGDNRPAVRIGRALVFAYWRGGRLRVTVDTDDYGDGEVVPVRVDVNAGTVWVGDVR